jgi:hypothetical protein
MATVRKYVNGAVIVGGAAIKFASLLDGNTSSNGGNTDENGWLNN